MSPKMVGDHETELDFRLLLNTFVHEYFQSCVCTISEVDMVTCGSSVADPEQVIYSRGDPGELIYEEDAGPEVNHTYQWTWGNLDRERGFLCQILNAQWRQECCGRQIINNGPWHVPELRLVINWPWRLADSKEDSYLLYVLASPTVIGDGFCTLELDSVNPLRLKVHLTGWLSFLHTLSFVTST
ncbi:ITGA7 [Cordylochernes scorpioides]|uniref:ITGA7 n=1 Tax=Cordylochernes scorpioides TaxID=51811 RepID=A0ABY6L5M4_9ARAC|nr:ITGA7 [Cordylochernes scorpioides]